MKRQLILLVSSVIGFMALASVAMAQAQPLISVEKNSEESQSMLKGRQGSVLSEVDNLDLTADQQEEIDAIRAGLSEQMAEILTPEQMETFQASQANGDDLRSTLRSLGLTSSQRSSVVSVMRSAQDDMKAVLTPEQQAQLEGERPRDRN